MAAVAAVAAVTWSSAPGGGFVNSGSGELRLVAIHGSSRFDTEWLAGPDPTWSSIPRS